MFLVIRAQVPVRIPFPIPVFDESDPVEDEYYSKSNPSSHYRNKQGKEGYTKYSSDNKYGGYDHSDYHKYTRKTMNKVHNDMHDGYHQQAREQVYSNYNNERKPSYKGKRGYRGNKNAYRF